MIHLEQTVYADILFLINFSMDYLCFYITSRLLHRKLPKVRTFLASVAGGLYSVLILIADFVSPLRLICDIAAGFLMCAAVFAEKELKIGKIALHSLAYVGVSSALGGIMTAIFNMMNTLGFANALESGGGDGMPVWIFAALSAISGFATLRGGRFLRQKQSERSADVEIELDGKKVKLTALCDSGNLVRDPISGKCIVVTDLCSVSPALPPEMLDAVRKNDMSAIESLPREHVRKIRFVPSRTATGSGMLYAIKPDRLTVTVCGVSQSVDALFAPVTLGASAGGFQALLPPELLV